MFRSCWCVPGTREREERLNKVSSKPSFNRADTDGIQKSVKQTEGRARDQREISANASTASIGGSEPSSFKTPIKTQPKQNAFSHQLPTEDSGSQSQPSRTATLQELSNKYKRGTFDPANPAGRLQTKRPERLSNSTPSPKTPSQNPDVSRRNAASTREYESATTSSDLVEEKDEEEEKNIFSTRSTLSNYTSGRPQPISELQNLLGVPESGLESGYSDQNALSLQSSERTRSGAQASSSQRSIPEYLSPKHSRECDTSSQKASKLPSLTSKSPRVESRRTKSSGGSRSHKTQKSQNEVKPRKSMGQAVRESLLRQQSFGTPITPEKETLEPYARVRTSMECVQMENHPYYKVLGALNKGSSGNVIVCLDQRTDEKVAVKLLSRGVNNSKVAEREIANLRLCAMHPYIIHMREVFLTSSHLAIVMDFAEGGNLATYIDVYQSSKAGRGISEERTRLIFQQIVTAVAFCHNLGFANRDIKLDNVLLVPNGDDKAAIPTVKLSDFGFSKDEYADSTCKTACGTPECVAPEVLTGGLYDGKYSDIWSLGVMFYAMLTGNYPFSRPADKDLDTNGSMRKLFSRIMSAQYAMPQHISKDAQDLLQKMLKVSPEERIEVADVLSHPYFTAHSKKSKIMSVNNSLLQVPDNMLTGFFPQTAEQIADILKQASRNPTIQTGESTLITQSKQYVPM